MILEISSGFGPAEAGISQDPKRLPADLPLRGCNAIQSVGCLWPRCSFLLQTSPHPNQSEGSLHPKAGKGLFWPHPGGREGDATWALEKPHFYFPSQFINQHLSLQRLSELASFLSFNLKKG